MNRSAGEVKFKSALSGPKDWIIRYIKIITFTFTFINKCLRRILDLNWTDNVSNTTLWKMTKQLPIENDIKKRKWRWIGHTLRKPPETITVKPSHRNPKGRGKDVCHEIPGKKRETKEMGYTRREMERMATGRKQWRSLVDGLCSQRANRHK